MTLQDTSKRASQSQPPDDISWKHKAWLVREGQEHISKAANKAGWWTHLRLSTQVRGSKHPSHLCQLIKALRVSLLPLHVTLLGITAIAVHDEGNMLGHRTCLENKDKQNRAESWHLASQSVAPPLLVAPHTARSAAGFSQLKDKDANHLFGNPSLVSL